MSQGAPTRQELDRETCEANLSALGKIRLLPPAGVEPPDPSLLSTFPREGRIEWKPESRPDANEPGPPPLSVVTSNVPFQKLTLLGRI